MRLLVRFGRLAPALTLLGAAIAAPLHAQGGAFLVRLGRDTINAERYDLDGTTLRGEIVGRQPRTSRLTYVAALAPDGAVTHLDLTRFASAAPDAKIVQTTAVDYRNDSAYLTIKRNDSTITRTAPAARNSMPGLGTVYAFRELAVLRAVASGATITALPMQPVGGSQPNMLPVVRAGDTLVMGTPVFTERVRVDKSGHFLSASAPNTTVAIDMWRVPALDIAQLGAAWAAQESAKGAMGQLSKDDTIHAIAGGANVTVSFGRPSLRGRTAFGTALTNPVKFDSIWRTGANWATALTTDKDLVIGGTTIPAGKYTLWTIPRASGRWTFIVNKKTLSTAPQSKGRFLWGTEYDAAEDLARVDITAIPTPQQAEMFDLAIEPSPLGGTIKITWDKTQARVSFTVK